MGMNHKPADEAQIQAVFVNGSTADDEMIHKEQNICKGAGRTSRRTKHKAGCICKWA
jgi:hypothetical protein